MNTKPWASKELTSDKGTVLPPTDGRFLTFTPSVDSLLKLFVIASVTASNEIFTSFS